MDESTCVEKLISFLIVQWNIMDYKRGYKANFETGLDFIKNFAQSMGIDLNTADVRTRWREYHTIGFTGVDAQGDKVSWLDYK